MEPTFFTLAEVIAIHRDQITRYGGSEGVRDWGLLQSAIATLAAGVGGRFLHADPCEMAAAYLFHIVRYHLFVDGNKRVGAVAAYVFLVMNNMRLTADTDAYAELVLSVARGECRSPTWPSSFGPTRPRTVEGPAPDPPGTEGLRRQGRRYSVYSVQRVSHAAQLQVEYEIVKCVCHANRPEPSQQAE